LESDIVEEHLDMARNYIESIKFFIESPSEVNVTEGVVDGLIEIAENQLEMAELYIERNTERSD
jgi:hypothetical protein